MTRIRCRFKIQSSSINSGLEFYADLFGKLDSDISLTDDIKRTAGKRIFVPVKMLFIPTNKYANTLLIFYSRALNHFDSVLTLIMII